MQLLLLHLYPIKPLPLTELLVSSKCQHSSLGYLLCLSQVSLLSNLVTYNASTSNYTSESRFMTPFTFSYKCVYSPRNWMSLKTDMSLYTSLFLAAGTAAGP